MKTILKWAILASTTTFILFVSGSPKAIADDTYQESFTYSPQDLDCPTGTDSQSVNACLRIAASQAKIDAIQNKYCNGRVVDVYAVVTYPDGQGGQTVSYPLYTGVVTVEGGVPVPAPNCNE